MSNYLYKAKRTDNGRWVEGLFCRDKKGNLIVPCIEIEHESDFGDWIERVEINGNTICQFTGLTDKKGKRIFEGDIVKSCEYDDVYAVRYFDYDGYPAFDCVPEVSHCECNGLSYLMCTEGVDVIGNIHDNPELLERSNENAE